MSTLTRRWIVNGEERTVEMEPLERLLDVLRDRLGLLSLKEGCGEGECGACTLLVNGDLRLACLTAAAQLPDGAELLTAEGLGQTALGRSLMDAFQRDGAVQCGYCTPGMLVGAYALLRERPAASVAEVQAHLAGNLCRCTGYSKIVQAVQTCGSLRPSGARETGR